jgi:diguanylate cyclase (GGDEF)-like protein/PAS domain S-box-containing protein
VTGVPESRCDTAAAASTASATIASAHVTACPLQFPSRGVDTTWMKDAVVGRAPTESAERCQWEQTFLKSTRGIMIADPLSGVILSVNPAFASMHGGAIDDFIGTSAVGLVSGDARSTIDARVQELDREGHIAAETEHVRLDGSTFPVSGEAITTRDAAGELQHWIAWFEDLTERRAAEQARRDASEIIEAAFAYAPNAVALIGIDGCFMRINAAVCEMLGRPSEELIGAKTVTCCHPDDVAVTEAAYLEHATSRTPVTIDKRFVRPDGTVVWAFCRGITVRDPEGNPRYMVSHFIDVTARRLAEQREAEAQQRFATAFADAPIGLALVGLDGRWIKVNRTLCELTGYSEVRLLELSFREITHPDDLHEDLREVERLLAGEIDTFRMETRYITAQGEVLWINLAVSLVRDSEHRSLHFIRQSEDISERKHLEASLQHLADHDSLTDVWNRRRFRDELRCQISRCQRYDEHAALLSIDLDAFKQVNDTYGHKAGDAMLKRIAEELRKRLRATDSLARVGGDEFAVILTHISADDTTQLAAILGEVVSASSIRADGVEIALSASIGVVLLDDTTTNAESALDRADRAMYKAKPTGRYR